MGCWVLKTLTDVQQSTINNLTIPKGILKHRFANVFSLLTKLVGLNELGVRQHVPIIEVFYLCCLLFPYFPNQEPVFQASS